MVKLLAKPDKTLIEHTEEVLEHSKKLVNQFGIDDDLRKRIFLACALHDTGKATKSFQNYIRGEHSKSFPHALASFPFSYIAEMKLFGNPILASASVVSHHTPLRDDVFDGFGGKPEYLKEQIYDFLDRIQKVIDIELTTPIKESEKHWSSITPLKIFKTIRNDHKLFNLNIDKYLTVKTILNLSDWAASSGTEEAIELQSKFETTKEQMRKRSFTLREFQIKAMQQTDGMYLKAPTGTGKTEAFLLWSKGKRLIYLLPTQATVNAMWKRLNEIYDRKNVGLSHSLSSLIIRKEGEFEDEENDMRVRGEILLSSVFAKPIVVATIDQYIMSALHGRHWENKAFLVKHSDMAIDEIHSYDAYTLGLLVGALKKFPPQRLGIGSATFPSPLYNLLVNELGKNTEIVAERELWSRRRHKVKVIEDSIDNYLNKAVRDAKNGKNVLVIANTVGDAQSLFEKLEDMDISKDRTMLLHSKFIYRDREEKEKHLLDFKVGSTNKGFILISTQVVEVSLDISFDVLYTEIAPIDALVQRLGRVNRKGEKSISDVFIFSHFGERTAKVYGNGDEEAGKDILDRSIELLKDISDKPEERELLKINNKLYERIFSKDTFIEKYKNARNKVEEFEELFGTYTINLSNHMMKEKFFTRETSVISQSVVPCKFRETVEKLIENKKSWKVPEYMVSIPAWWLKDLASEKTYSYVTIANMEYSERYGALKKSSAECHNIL